VAQAAGIVLVAGAITAANELLFAPAAGGAASSFNWRIVPATAGLAVALTGVEKLAPRFGTGLAWLTLAASLIVPAGTASSPITNISKALGYK
jgi:hypothetical protein